MKSSPSAEVFSLTEANGNILVHMQELMKVGIHLQLEDRRYWHGRLGR
ncbi:hypothetical protein [Rubinisphaera sp.]|nr:hypothetical protein [Rubinisphaera sp.]